MFAHYPSGEHIRLALAKGFINDPRLLLLDEPTASLDPVIARHMRNRIYERIKKSRGAVIWTSHNMREVETMCTRIIFLSRGVIIEDDTPKNLHARFNTNDLEDVFVSLAGSPLDDSSVNNVINGESMPHKEISL